MTLVLMIFEITYPPKKELKDPKFSSRDVVKVVMVVIQKVLSGLYSRNLWAIVRAVLYAKATI